MTVHSIRSFLNQHTPSALAVAALGALLDAKVSGKPLDPVLEARVIEFLSTFGIGDVTNGVTADEVRPMLSMMQMSLPIDAKLISAATRSLSWNHTEPEILKAGGDTAQGFVKTLSEEVIPALEGLEQRFATPGASFLDIGTGVGKLAIAMCERYPSLSALGIDPWQPALAIARENLAEAGLEDRIALREQAGEHLQEEETFDLAWVPSPFVPASLIRAVSERAARSLRPGGWILYAMPNLDVDERTAAMWRLRVTVYGGWVSTSGDVEKLLTRLGLVGVQTLPPCGPIAMVAGRRPTA